MTKFQDKWFKRWESKRRKGLIYYTFTQTLIMGGAVVVGRFLGVAFFTNQSQWEEFFTGLPILAIIFFGIGIPLNAIAWFIGEKRYQNLLNERKNT
ncbi:hypothetical protein HAR83_003264 [Vibrio metschnikovii]|uniref:hypothetical protein n=1 Tax=Vibrio TaxID=662 RepID=UPI001482C5E0|nr:MULTISPECIES: hypothetical protein [unclassified Vibrio]EKO3793815.1 hypothetical protein [Vibrio metschnikovii]EKO3895912.1 hypothetical protein [Vibrio metschnikovii]EKO3914786.1 hypothetical protein [Vibrio metschnikovii]NNN46250.1 hypothetical protein [Vibrio sp. 1-1(7)]NNN74130.1 hypothetical protein [Vibrio sp. 12-2(3-a)]